jgi:hypothetical protein
MQNEVELSRNKAKENFDYFLQQRALRLQCLRSFLKKFEIDATTDDSGLAAVSRWFDLYGGLLLHFRPRDTSSLNAFVSYAPPWTGEHLGINVVWDIGIYLGECIIARRRSAYWDLDTGDPDPVSLEAIGYQRPCVAGLYWPTSADTLTRVFIDSQSMSRENRFVYRTVSLRKSLTFHVTNWSCANPPNPTRGQMAQR